MGRIVVFAKHRRFAGTVGEEVFAVHIIKGEENAQDN
jgi:hypothetical protein